MNSKQTLKSKHRAQKENRSKSTIEKSIACGDLISVRVHEAITLTVINWHDDKNWPLFSVFTFSFFQYVLFIKSMHAISLAIDIGLRHCHHLEEQTTKKKPKQKLLIGWLKSGKCFINSKWKIWSKWKMIQCKIVNATLAIAADDLAWSGPLYNDTIEPYSLQCTNNIINDANLALLRHLHRLYVGIDVLINQHIIIKKCM